MPADHSRAEPATWYLPPEGIEVGVARNEVLLALRDKLSPAEASSFTTQAVDGYVAIITQRPDRFSVFVEAITEYAARSCGLKYVGQGPAINDGRNYWSRPVPTSV